MTLLPQRSIIDFKISQFKAQFEHICGFNRLDGVMRSANHEGSLCKFHKLYLVSHFFFLINDFKLCAKHFKQNLVLSVCSLACLLDEVCSISSA